jgi:hypothetical protein
MMREGISFATGLRWHIASGKRDRQLIAAAKKGRLNHSPSPLVNVDAGIIPKCIMGYTIGTREDHKVPFYPGSHEVYTVALPTKCPRH